MPAEAATTIDTKPTPPRFWWLKRITIVTVLLAGLLMALRYLALHIAKRRLNAQLAAIKARGEPLEPQDFADRPVPLQDDAGPDLLAAARMFGVPKQYQTAWDQTHFILGPQNSTTIAAILSANQEALAKVRSARDKRFVNWGLPMRKPTDSPDLPLLRQLHDVGDALGASAQKALEEGRSDEAVEYFRDWLMLERSLENRPILLWHIFAQQCYIASFAKGCAPKFRIGPGAGAASEAQMKALIKELLEDNDSPRSGRRWAWQGERMMQMDLIHALASEDEATRAAMGVNIHSRFVRWWMRPMEVAIAQDLLGIANTRLEAIGARNLAEAEEVAYEWERRFPRIPELSSVLSIRGYLRPEFEAMYWRREAAVALAGRVFKSKYKREPDDIRELVPEFFAQIPINPLPEWGPNYAAALITDETLEKNTKVQQYITDDEGHEDQKENKQEEPAKREKQNGEKPAAPLR
jgi:hypothetical protein